MHPDIHTQALALARTAMPRAYVPYSGFRMGAAVVTEREILLPGALVENVSLSLMSGKGGVGKTTARRE
jgi:cytidine deaminase